MATKKNKNLILLTSDYPYAKGETFLENEVSLLSSYFKEVLIVSCSLSAKRSREIPKNVNTFIFNPKKSIKNYLTLLNKNFLQEFAKNIFSNPLKNKVAINSWLFATALADKIESVLSDDTILYAYWLDDKALALAILKSRHKNLVVVSRAHRWDIYEEEHLYQYLPFRTFLFEQLSKIYSISSDGMNYLKSKGANNVEISRLGTLRSGDVNADAQSQSVHVISISYLIKRKRISLLVDALKILDKEGISIKWTHFGDGPEIEKLKERSKHIQHIDIDFKGFVSNPELMAWINDNCASGLLINLSESEGIPVSMMEAMSFGIPCIGTDVGGVSEIINDGYNGFLLPATPKAQEVANKLAQYYKLTREEKSKMKKNALTSWEVKYNAKTNFNDYCQKLLSL